MKCFINDILLSSGVLNDSAIILTGHISGIMSELSEIHCQCQCFNLFRPRFPYRFSFSFPHLSFTSYYTLLTRISLSQRKWKKNNRTSCLIFFLHLLCAVVAFEKSLLCFIWHVAFAPLLHRTVIEQPILTISRPSSACSPGHSPLPLRR